MKNYLLIIITLFFVQKVNAQSKLQIGPVYNISASTILSNGNSRMSGMAMGNSQPNWGVKLNPGVFLKAEYMFSEKIGAYLQTGYQQRGAIFKDYMDDYKPRYRLNYLDVNLGVQLTPIKNIGKLGFVTSIGITQHTLLSADRVYDTGSDNIFSDFNSNTFGIYTALGCNISLFDKNILQLLVFGNYSLSQIYRADMQRNGMMGKNLLFGLQIGYLLGKSSVNK